MKPAAREIHVYADWNGIEHATSLGLLRAVPTRGKEVFSFEYDPEWLKSGHATLLDPRLRLFAGPQYPADTQTNFGIFLDSSPDRWGRVLMRRREVMVAPEEERPARTLLESQVTVCISTSRRRTILRIGIS